MAPLGKLLIIGGALMILVGIMVMFGPKVPWLGRLPGDIRVEGKNGSFYFPIVTCITISIILSIIMNFFRGR